jgi:cytochrome c553
MMDAAPKNLILPAFIGTAVLLIALTLLMIVLGGPYTHANLNPGYDPRYTRTEQMFVGTPLPYPGGMLAVPRSSDPVQLGKQLFVANDCAACHGLDGRGGIIGPSIVGTTADKLRVKTKVGSQGMPAYEPAALSDSDLAAMAAYLEAMGK